MRMTGARIVLTGAAGGIGQELALALADRGGELLLVDRDNEALALIQGRIQRQGGRARVHACDLTDQRALQTLVQQAQTVLGGVDVLINCAGVSSFTNFEQERPDMLELLWRVNVLAPMHLTRMLLPQMQQRGSGRIVNVGSIFGSIGFAYFTSYSASKFAMRGFSESLRRELEGTGIGVTYVAPRFTRTPINNSAVNRMAEAVGMNADDPKVVASLILRAIAQDRNDCYLGWPESLFVRINAILPRLVDFALRKQNRQTRNFAVAND
ncbi:short-chain dehydrogenase [Novimethylophilus kurashikiensis]|uniref:Short-chain dehydrogenase n=1 Tax=Novimethylophilus kurashikiensis TaxID=1825523 RepID=A0A2R5FCG8_9PROT|nr:SDR family oxidoreductase [Novimethylophilus kurashikiensis]GBG15912.1 short-chain dehydrogenase [Novimethylophilus kurashikiensis]